MVTFYNLFVVPSAFIQCSYKVLLTDRGAGNFKGPILPDFTLINFICSHMKYCKEDTLIKIICFSIYGKFSEFKPAVYIVD